MRQNLNTSERTADADTENRIEHGRVHSYSYSHSHKTEAIFKIG